MAKWYRLAFLTILGSLATIPAFANDDRVSFASDIVVAEGSTSGDVVCVLCSVKAHGEVHGDIVTVLGSVTVDDGRSVSGDVVSIGGDVSLRDGASVKGDVAVLAGELSTGTGASVGGDRNVMAGQAWLLLPLAAVLILAGVIWLVVWLATRRRYPVPRYPQGRQL